MNLSKIRKHMFFSKIQGSLDHGTSSPLEDLQAEAGALGAAPLDGLPHPAAQGLVTNEIGTPDPNYSPR